MFNATRVSGLVALAAAGIIMAGFSASLKADSLTDKATVTFDRPVEVPGKVLPAGTYVFKAVDNEELVQVFSRDERQLFATVSVVPEDRPLKSNDGDCLVQLTNNRVGAPQGVEGFFMPGRVTGYQFVYPANQTRRVKE